MTHHHYITPEISPPDANYALVIESIPSAEIANRLVSQATQIDNESLFGDPVAYIAKIQEQYIAENRYRFYISDSHSCLYDQNCTHIQLRVSVFRYRSATGTYVYHMCFTDKCKHVERNHVCRLADCPHRRSYSSTDTFIYQALFACTRTGKLHLCGAGFCCAPFTDTARGGMHTCPLTGIVLGSVLVLDMTPEAGGGPIDDAVEYGDAMMIEGDDDAYRIDDNRLEYSRREFARARSSNNTVKLLTGGGGMRDSHWQARMSKQEQIQLREYRMKKAAEELQKHVFGAPTTVTFESVMRPIKNIEEMSHSRAWPGTLEMMCQVHAALPQLVHPSWGQPLQQPRWMPSHRIGNQGERETAQSLAKVCVDIFERVERTARVDFTFDAAIAAILHMMRVGVVLPPMDVGGRRNESVVVVPQYQEMRWYAKRKLVPAVYTMQKTMTDALKQAYINDRLGISSVS